jgi:hypothetical protein
MSDRLSHTHVAMAIIGAGLCVLCQGRSEAEETVQHRK